MSSRRILGVGRNAAVAVIPLLIILAPLGHAIYVEVLADDVDDAQAFLELPAEPNDGCVRETTYMRFHHWELLREVRDEVVRGGVRKEISLTRCRECHPSREKFCNRCHQAVSLEPDCFGCHYYPAAAAGQREVTSR